MDILNRFETQGEHPFLFNGKKPAKEGLGEHRAQADSQWRRVLGVILVEGEMRYLVERGE